MYWECIHFLDIDNTGNGASVILWSYLEYKIRRLDANLISLSMEISLPDDTDYIYSNFPPTERHAHLHVERPPTPLYTFRRRFPMFAFNYFHTPISQFEMEI